MPLARADIDIAVGGHIIQVRAAARMGIEHREDGSKAEKSENARHRQRPHVHLPFQVALHHSATDRGSREPLPARIVAPLGFRELLITRLNPREKDQRGATSSLQARGVSCHQKPHFEQPPSAEPSTMTARMTDRRFRMMSRPGAFIAQHGSIFK